MSLPPSLPSETLKFAHRMFDAAREGNVELLLGAIDAGLPVDLCNDQGNTLLMLAAYSSPSNVVLVRGLLERGANINRLNDQGQSILAGALFKGFDDTVSVLLEERWKVDIRAGQPNAVQTAVMFAKQDWLKKMGGANEDDLKDIPTPMLPPS